MLCMFNNLEARLSRQKETNDLANFQYRKKKERSISERFNFGLIRFC